MSGARIMGGAAEMRGTNVVAEINRMTAMVVVGEANQSKTGAVGHQWVGTSE